MSLFEKARHLLYKVVPEVEIQLPRLREHPHLSDSSLPSVEVDPAAEKLRQVRVHRDAYLRLCKDAEEGHFARNLQGCSLYEMVYLPSAFDLSVRQDDNRLLVRRLTKHLIDHPGDQVADLVIMSSCSNHLNPASDLNLNKHVIYLGLTANNGDHSRTGEAKIVVPYSESAHLSSEYRKDNWDAFRGVTDSKGNGYALIEYQGRPVLANSLESPVPDDNYQYVMLQNIWDNVVAAKYGAKRHETLLHEHKGQMQGQAHPVDIQYVSLVRFKADIPIPPKPSTHVTTYSDRAVSHRLGGENLQAEAGLCARNGVWWAFPLYVGPECGQNPVEGAPPELTGFEQNYEFLKLLVKTTEGKDAANNEKKAWEVEQTHFQKWWELLRLGEGQPNSYGTFYEALVRGVDREKQREFWASNSGTEVDRSPSPYYLSPNVPATQTEQTSNDWRRQNAPAEQDPSMRDIERVSLPIKERIERGMLERDGGGSLSRDDKNEAARLAQKEARVVLERDKAGVVLNRFGEGWALIEVVHASLGEGELNLGQQRFEIIKTLTDWSNRHPEFDIEESHLISGEGNVLAPDIKSKYRRVLLRIKDTRWPTYDEETRSKIYDPEVPLRKMELQRPRVEGETLCFEAMARNAQKKSDSESTNKISAWEGYEKRDGRGFALIEFIGASPIEPGTETVVNTREHNFEWIKLLTRWSEEFPWRKIKQVEFIKRWDNHHAPEYAFGSFDCQLLVYFDRRTEADLATSTVDSKEIISTNNAYMKQLLSEVRQYQNGSKGKGKSIDELKSLNMSMHPGLSDLWKPFPSWKAASIDNEENSQVSSPV